MTVQYRIDVKDRRLSGIFHGWYTIHFIDAEESEDVPKHIEELAIKECFDRNRRVRIVKINTIKLYKQK